MPARKRGNVWYARFQINGRPIERAAGPKKKDAIDLETKIRQEATNDRVGRARDYLIDDALTAWLEGEARALESIEDIKAKIRFITPYTAGRKLSEAPAVAAEIKKAMLAEGLNVITINRRLANLRRVCRLAVEWKWIESAPPVKMLPGEKARTVALTEEQFDTFISHVPKGPIMDAMVLNAYTGLRPGELFNLTKENVKDGHIVVKRKTKIRAIPIPAHIRPILRKIPLDTTYSRFRTALEKAREVAKMPYLQHRDLRRTYGSWIVQRTGNLKAAQDLLGHTTPVITAKHYAHLLTGHLVEAVSTLNRAKTGQGKAKKRAAKK